MMNVIYILTAMLAVIILTVMLFNYVFYYRYADRSEHHCLAAIVFTVSMSLAVLCILLIPIDVFIANDKVKEIINVNIDMSQFNQIMLIAFAALLSMSFAVIPFTYFYIDDKIEDIVPIDNEFMYKICSAVKHTFFFIIFIVVIIITGLFFKGNSSLSSSNSHLQTLKILFDTEHFGEKAISFTMSIFSVFGMIFIIFYAGYGMGALPFFLIKGKNSLASAHERFEFDRAKKRDRIRTIQEKMTRKGTWTQKEKKELIKLKEEEVTISYKMDKISAIIENDSCINKILVIMTPFRVLIGIFCLIMTLMIFISLLLTSLDRYLHSECGYQCGFVINENKYKNIIDYVLLSTSKYYHLDHLLFAIVNLYMFISAIFGFCTIGIKFLCVTLFEIQKRSTNPQGLLVLSFEISMMTIAFVLEMITLCPQYATFGPQLTSDGLKCNMNNMKKCIMTNIAVFYNKISISMPFFSTVFYFANWGLIAVIAMSTLYGMICRKDEEYDDYKEEGDDEEKFALNSGEY